MPKRPPTLCCKPGCGALTTSRFCHAHASEEKREIDKNRPNAAARGYCSAKWKRLRKLILHRDPICKICQKQLSTDVDHIVDKAIGGMDSMDNLQGLCHNCHSQKTGFVGK